MPFSAVQNIQGPLGLLTAWTFLKYVKILGLMFLLSLVLNHFLEHLMSSGPNGVELRGTEWALSKTIGDGLDVCLLLMIHVHGFPFCQIYGPVEPILEFAL